MNWLHRVVSKPQSGTDAVMANVLLALLPGIFGLTLMFGAGLWLNLAVAVATALATEWVCLRLRGVGTHPLADMSALLTAVLLALCLPPGLHPVITMLGSIIAIALGKQVYGGIGLNPFNPAMVGYAAILVSFPSALAIWPTPFGHAAAVPGLDGAIVDGVTMATPLDAFRNRGSITAEEFRIGYAAAMAAQVDAPLPDPWPWLSAAWLCGGAYLAARRIARWQAGAGMLLALGTLSLVFHDADSSAGSGSPWFHLTHGAALFAAVFIVTDPASSPRTRRGQWLFGLGVGVIVWLIRTRGSYPDGVAFAVLVMNGFAPLLDRMLDGWRMRPRQNGANA